MKKLDNVYLIKIMEKYLEILILLEENFKRQKIILDIIYMNMQILMKRKFNGLINMEINRLQIIGHIFHLDHQF